MYISKDNAKTPFIHKQKNKLKNDHGNQVNDIMVSISSEFRNQESSLLPQVAASFSLYILQAPTAYRWQHV